MSWYGRLRFNVVNFILANFLELELLRMLTSCTLNMKKVRQKKIGEKWRFEDRLYRP
jgi:hypothetical protein